MLKITYSHFVLSKHKFVQTRVPPGFEAQVWQGARDVTLAQTIKMLKAVENFLLSRDFLEFAS